MAATKELTLGELLHDELFGLFEAMSAIEMMDPKMDAGMSCNRAAASRPYTFVTAAESGHLKLKDVTNAEMIAVFDSTLACLVTWLEGHSLAQTVFTNLYLHQPLEADNPPMKAFSVAVFKLLQCIKELVTKGCAYEEEDFQPSMYGFSLKPDVSEARASGMLREVEDSLRASVRGTRAKEGEPARDDDTLRQHEEANALFARFRFCRQLYAGLALLVQAKAAESARALTVAREQIPSLAATVNLGASTPEDGNLMGFERMANQRLLPPTFPRYTQIKEKGEAVAYLGALLDRLLIAAKVAQVDSFHGAMEFFSNFTSLNPCVLSRSVVQALFVPLGEAVKASMAPNPPLHLPPESFVPQPSYALSTPPAVARFAELLKDSCRAFIAPPALVTPRQTPFNAKEIKDCIDAFFVQCLRPMTLLLQLHGHNRARQRDRLVTLLEEFVGIQEEAEKLDNLVNAASLRAGPPQPEGKPIQMYFATWLLYHVVRLMVRYVLSGFELELYATHEFPYVYWYLYELLYPWLNSCLTRADNALRAAEASAEAKEREQKAAHGKSKKKIKSSSKKNKQMSSSRPYAKEMGYNQGYALMCCGYYKLAVALKSKGKLAAPVEDFDDESVRYDHRFSPFGNLISPPLMPYAQFAEVREHTLRARSPAELFSSAAADFARSRQFFENATAASQQTAPPSSSVGADPLPALISVLKNNFVVAGVLAKTDGGREVTFDFGAGHRTFPNVRLV